ncbi:MAG: glycosyltransferase [Methanomassiliicoccales archaeon]|nr:MAG: glycosyltransferase [Methanomassiliicoccales archaeon]
MKLKILNYHPFFLPSRGGTETNIFSFAEHSRHEHYVLTDMLPDTKEQEKVGAVEVVRARPSHLSTPPLGVAPADAFLELPRELVKMLTLRDFDYDILHLRFGSITPRLFVGIDNRIGRALFTKLAAWRTSNQPVLVTFHTLPSHTDSGLGSEASSRYNKSWREIETFFCGQAESIICLDEFMVEPLRDMSGGKQVFLVPSGVDTDLFKPADREQSLEHLPSSVREAIDESKTNVLSVARVEPVKGAHLLRQLSEVLPDDINLIIAGRGYKSPEAGWRNTKLVGDMPNEMIPHLINSCDMAINLTVAPGVGRFTFEAIACGKPTIRLSPGKLHPLTDKKNVLLVQDITEALKWIRELHGNDSLRKEMSQHALETRDTISVSTYAKEVDSIYEEIVGGND